MSVPRVAEFMGDMREHLRVLAQRVNAALSGKLDNIGTVTLTASSATTVVTDARCGGDSAIFYTPTTANAAVATANVYTSSIGKGTFTITHANNAQTDRTFDYAIIS
jgi:hypothetical protein